MTNIEGRCACCSHLPYDICCQPFHQGLLPQNALQLMRSRYSAYALDLPHYIVETTHPKNSAYETDILAWIHSVQEFSRKTTFLRLEILQFHEEGDRATVTFTAHLTQEGRPATFTEKSTFVKEHHRWWYLSGEMHT